MLSHSWRSCHGDLEGSLGRVVPADFVKSLMVSNVLYCASLLRYLVIKTVTSPYTNYQHVQSLFNSLMSQGQRFTVLAYIRALLTFSPSYFHIRDLQVSRHRYRSIYADRTRMLPANPSEARHPAANPPHPQLVTDNATSSAAPPPGSDFQTFHLPPSTGPDPSGPSVGQLPASVLRAIANGPPAPTLHTARLHSANSAALRGPLPFFLRGAPLPAQQVYPRRRERSIGQPAAPPQEHTALPAVNRPWFTILPRAAPSSKISEPLPDAGAVNFPWRGWWYGMPVAMDGPFWDVDKSKAPSGHSSYLSAMERHERRIGQILALMALRQYGAPEWLVQDSDSKEEGDYPIMDQWRI